MVTQCIDAPKRWKQNKLVFVNVFLCMSHDQIAREYLLIREHMRTCIFILVVSISHLNIIVFLCAVI